MFKLHTLQAKNGDCLVLEFGKTDDPKYILIDGGPDDVFFDSLENFLVEKNLTNSDSFEVMVLTHVDEDHVIGLMDYLDFLDDYNEGTKPPEIKEVWHNYLQYEVDPDGTIEFADDSSRTRGLDNRAFEKTFKNFWDDIDEFNDSKYNLSTNRFPSNFLTRSIKQGDEFRDHVEDLEIPINKSFHPKNEIVVEDHPTVHFDNVQFDIIGPSKTILDKLIKKWRKWVEDQVRKGNLTRSGKDPRIPNRSSIMFVATSGDGENAKNILFTGDGRGDYIIYGLKERGLLSDDEDDYYFTDVLKLPHHGSEYNVTPEFFKKVQATHYVASGNGGQYKNPSTETLTMIAEASKDQERDVIIWVTYDNTPQINAFRNACPINDGYRYEIRTVDPGKVYFTIDLS